ncbi:NIPSNAP family protein [Haliscomenobacter sp.]|uniref:NIPSNAP family protein n=1 Tax=Haliscomenobacter sp. TaxID=2717303 RepID=UPI003BAADB87
MGMVYSFFLCLSSLFSSNEQEPKGPEPRYYEIQIHQAEPGRLKYLQNRYRQFAIPLYRKHNIQVEGFWSPVDPKDERIVSVLSYYSQASWLRSTKDFLRDPKWKKGIEDSESVGRLEARSDKSFMRLTDFSAAKFPRNGTKGRVFELRTYYATPGKLPNLLERFRNHTRKLFEKYGMTNLWYWTVVDAYPAQETLIYMLAHPSQEAGLKAFTDFRNDPEWIKVRKDSEDKAGGSLTLKVESLYLKPLDFSPIK